MNNVFACHITQNPIQNISFNDPFSGTYNPFTGRGNVSECTACSGGRYCPYYNMTQPGPQCQEGEENEIVDRSIEYKFWKVCAMSVRYRLN